MVPGPTCRAYGWFWQPGRTWAGWNTVPRIVNASASTSRSPAARHARTDLGGEPRRAGRARSAWSRTGSEIRSGSAGLGVPRGSVRNLGKISRQMERTVAGGPASGSAGRIERIRLPACQHLADVCAAQWSSPRSGGLSAAAQPRSGGSPRMSAGSGLRRRRVRRARSPVAR